MYQTKVYKRGEKQSGHYGAKDPFLSRQSIFLETDHVWFFELGYGMVELIN